jgi:acetolactate synthase-1/2/3 large subunit
MKAAELLVRCLENEGVERIFGLPGEENLDVMDALLDSPIHFVLCRHEQGAAFMADVHGRLTGEAGVCLSTLGPGATNLVTGVADANLDHAPLVAITGQAGLARMHKESHQYLDLVRLFEPITKYNAQVKRAQTVPEVVRKAFKVARTEKPGACHIDLPEDEAAAEVAGGMPLLRQQPFTPVPSDHQIERAVAVLREARSPLILAGNGVIRGRAAAALTRFAERLNIPVAHTFMAKGAIPYTHPLSLGSVGLQAHDYIARGFDIADCVIAVGYDLVEYSPDQWNPQQDKRILHVDASPAEVDAHYIVEVGVVGEIATALERLAERAPASQGTGYASLRNVIREQLAAHADDPGFPVKPQRILSEMRRALGPEDIVVSDVGAHKLWIARMYPAVAPNTCLISNGFAAMGIALPGAIAAAFLHPDRRILAATGDAGFLMNLQELETAVRERRSVVALVFNDGGYGLIDWKQRQHFGRTSHVAFGNPDFVALAESFGALGLRVTAADELGPALEAAFAAGRPAVIDCPVDYRENLRLTEELGRITCAL